MTNVTNTENVANNVANEKVQHSISKVSFKLRKGWIAMEKGGYWYWFSKRPYFITLTGRWDTCGGTRYAIIYPEILHKFPKGLTAEKSLMEVEDD